MKYLLKYWPLMALILFFGILATILILIPAPPKEKDTQKKLPVENTEDIILSEGELSQIQESLPGFVETTDSEQAIESVSNSNSEEVFDAPSTSDGTLDEDGFQTGIQSSAKTIYNPEEYEAVAKRKSVFPEIPRDLTINGVTCIYDESSDTYCYAISERVVGKTKNLVFTGKYNDSNLCVLFPDGEIQSDGKYLFSANQTLNLRIFTESYYADAKLRMSTIPIMAIETENRTPLPTDKDTETKLYCTITLQDPDADLHNADAYLASYATVRHRGASSLAYPKKSMKIELKKFKEENGNTVMTERKKHLLGMRDDDDWILDAIYADPTLLHNKAAYDLWEELGGKTNPDALLAGPKSEYVEVILNGSYHGVFLLVEPVDEKQMGVQKSTNTADGSHGIFVKTTSWDCTKFDTITGSPKKSNGTWKSSWQGFEMKYPETEIQEKDWTPILELLEATVNGNDQEFTKVASRYLNKENVVNYWIFLSVTLARDNAGKNVCWSMANTTNKDGKLYINVWDCDNTFGYRYGKPPVKDPPDTQNYADTWFYLLRRYLECNVDGSKDYLKERWNEVSKGAGICSAASLQNRLNRIADYLETSGAFAREQARWPADGNVHASCPNSIATEMEYASQWIQQRIPIVNQIVEKY